MGILERRKDGKHSTVRTAVVPNRKKNALQAEVRKYVEVGSALYTDALQSYNGLDEFQHQVIDHAIQYVDGHVHTNGMENFWSLLKRGLQVPTFQSSRSICSATSMNRCTVSIIVS
jgi:transposase-like protein